MNSRTMTSARNTGLNQLEVGMLIVYVSGFTNDVTLCFKNKLDTCLNKNYGHWTMFPTTISFQQAY
jgi:hypothetical protein